MQDKAVSEYDGGRLPPAPKNLRERVGEDGSLTVFSKRSERLRKKQQRKRAIPADAHLTLLDLPFDILFQVVTFLRPSDVFRLSRTCRPLHGFLLKEHPARISRSIIQWRYPVLEKCMRLPVLISDVSPKHQDALQDEKRLRGHDIRRHPYYHHVTAPDPARVCTCLTCVLRWHVLCLAVDFAHWQPALDAGEPLPVVPRGVRPPWNAALLAAHAAVVERAVFPCAGGTAAPLWHAVILEAHLASTVRAIRRHSANKSNRRKRFQMTERDAAVGTDVFLEGEGPPSMDMPFHRDNYYMLEAYLPNRSWFPEKSRWGYLPAEQHDKDLEQLRKFVLWRRSRDQQGDGGGGGGRREEKWVMRFDGSAWKPTLVLGGRGSESREQP